MIRSLAVVDSGPLYAALTEDDQDHARCVEALADPTLQLFIPAMVVAEVCYLAGQRLGARVEAGFLAALAEYDVRAPAGEDWLRMADLVRQYADLPLGATDASVVALAERIGATSIITLDRRHFSAIKPRHCESFRLLPAQTTSSAEWRHPF